MERYGNVQESLTRWKRHSSELFVLSQKRRDRTWWSAGIGQNGKVIGIVRWLDCAFFCDTGSRVWNQWTERKELDWDKDFVGAFDDIYRWPAFDYDRLLTGLKVRPFRKADSIRVCVWSKTITWRDAVVSFWKGTKNCGCWHRCHPRNESYRRIFKW